MDESKKTALQAVDEQAGLFTALADKIWDDPELSLKEFMATEIYCDALRKLGFQVTEKLCGIDTAFCGSYGSQQGTYSTCENDSGRDGNGYRGR